jgi:cytochrome P450
MLADTISNGKRLAASPTIANGRILLMPYNDLWRTARKIMHQLLTTKAAESYRPFQDMESKQLCWDYLHNPDDFWLHNARYANSGNHP